MLSAFAPRILIEQKQAGKVRFVFAKLGRGVKAVGSGVYNASAHGVVSGTGERIGKVRGFRAARKAARPERKVTFHSPVTFHGPKTEKVEPVKATVKSTKPRARTAKKATAKKAAAK